MRDWTMTEEQLLRPPNRMLRFPTVEEWKRVFPTKDPCSDEGHITLTCVQCGEALVAPARDIPKIERLGLQPICATCVELKAVISGDGPIFGGTL